MAVLIGLLLYGPGARAAKAARRCLAAWLEPAAWRKLKPKTFQGGWYALRANELRAKALLTASGNLTPTGECAALLALQVAPAPLTEQEYAEAASTRQQATNAIQGRYNEQEI
jgi:hypothetical protein